MSITKLNEQGEVVIDKEVLKKIVAYSAKQNYGVVGMANKESKGDIAELLSFFDSTKGVEIAIDQSENLYITLYIIVQYGVKIQVVADNLIDKIKYDVESQTSLKVKKIQVNVEGVKIAK